MKRAIAFLLSLSALLCLGGLKSFAEPDRLIHGRHLASKVQPLLPPGTTVDDCARGFKNKGQFIAAAHVSHNLGIPFDQFKAEMLGPANGSLEKAVYALRPDLSSKEVKEQVKRAEKQAEQEMKYAKKEAKMAEKQAEANERSFRPRDDQ